MSSEILDLTAERLDRKFPERVAPLWWEKLLACIQCGTCSSSCPTAHAMDYTPRRLWQMVRLGMVDEVLASRTFWLCTACKSCQVRCPRDIRITETMIALKEFAVGQQANVPAAYTTLRDTLQAKYNISADDNADRLIWSQNLERIPDGVQPRNADVLYFVGCVGAFYPRAYSIPQSVVQVLDRAEVNFSTLGGEEWCCGYPLYVAGMRDDMRAIAEHNVERMRAMGAKRVVFSCPSCYYAWNHLYPDMVDMRGIQMQHVSEYYAELLAEGKLRPGPVNYSVTYHDPCDLGRKSGVYEAPRQVLRAIPRLDFREMQASGVDALCCGGGGDVEMGAPEVTQDVAVRRVGQVAETGAQYVVSACQQCKRTLTEGARKARVRVRTLDISELLWEALQK